MGLWSGVKRVLATVAPFIGSLVGGPLGGAAGQQLAEFLTGDKNASPKVIERALRNATPAQLIALKKLDLDFKQSMAEIGITEQEIAAMDRDSARKREMVIKDHIPGILSILLTLGVFAAWFALFYYPMQPAAKGLLDTMLGSVSTVWIMAMTYYYGSSVGSKRKTDLMGGR